MDFIQKGRRPPRPAPPRPCHGHEREQVGLDTIVTLDNLLESLSQVCQSSQLSLGTHLIGRDNCHHD